MSSEDIAGAVSKIRTHISQLDGSNFSLDLGVDPEGWPLVAEEMLRLVQLRYRGLSAADFVLEPINSPLSMNQLEIRCCQSAFTADRHIFRLLQLRFLTMENGQPGTSADRVGKSSRSGEEIFNGSLADLLRKGAAQVISDKVVRLCLPPLPTQRLKLEISFLGSAIMKSGQIFQCRPEESNTGTAVIDEGRPVAGSVLPGPAALVAASSSALVELDSSDLVSLDLTSRTRGPPVVDAAGGRVKVSRPSNLSEVPEEATLEDSIRASAICSSILDASTPFSPHSDRCTVSTMRDTVASARHLQKALAIINAVDELPSIVERGGGGESAVVAGSDLTGTVLPDVG
jgi:hypothetical protein